MEHFISLYIDNELSLEEKKQFLEQVHANRSYMDEAVAFLEQEKILKPRFNVSMSDSFASVRKKRAHVRTVGLALAATIVCTLVFLAGSSFNERTNPARHNASVAAPVKEYRFVIYLEETESVDIVGTFNNWQRTPLIQNGSSGYWEAVIPLPPGEHRYSFLVDGDIALPDPSIASREMDDFGMLNSILDG